MGDKQIIMHIIDELRMGGAQTHLRTMLKYWVPRSKYKHLVVSLFGDGVIGDSLREIGVEVISLNLAKDIQDKNFWQAQNKIYHLIKEKNPKLVEAHLTYSRLLGLWAAKRAKVEKRFGFEQGDIYFNSFKWRLINFFGQFLAQKIIVCSNTLSSWVKNTHFVYSKKLEVFYNCVDPDKFKISVNSQVNRESLQIPNEAFVFCAVGTLGSGVNKRMDICIQAISHLNQQHQKAYLIICGDGPQRTELENLSESLGVKSQIIFLGMRNDIPDIMNISNAFCHAAPFEPFGIVCIEAMLMKLPVIVPSSGGISEIVENGKTGYKYQPLDHVDLAKQMLMLIQAKEKSQKMGLEGYNFVLNNMTVGHYMRGLTQLYGIN